MTDTAQSKTEAYYRQLCEHIGVALIATDADLSIRAWNLAAARMFGAASDRMIGTPVISVIPQNSREEGERILKRPMATGETFQFEFQYRDDQGRERELMGTIAPVVSESGERVGASICIRDITRRMTLQDEVNQSRKMASLGELAGAMAHHFNNILGGVITSVDYANESGDPAVLRRVTRKIGRALQRAATLVNGLLAFAEGDRRADDLSDFTEVVNDVADEFERATERRGIELILDMPQLPVLSVVRSQVHTILHNIVQNAIEAMPDGGTLRIDVSLEDKSLITRVSDTGCGLDEAARVRIFEPFWSTKGMISTDTGEGTGLGLAIAHGLVQMLGGSIRVTSELKKGSCFTVILPRPDN
ncbi:MAG: two-component system sensor histidine kinase NtrB [Planctomycetota bacterium]|jgi:PAS domain S-box-containing protein